MLYSIVHDNKSKLWCGPAAIAAVTGHPTSVITQMLREVSGRASIKGVDNSELLTVMRQLGYAMVDSSRPWDKITLAEFAKRNASLFAKRPMIVQITGHYVVLAGRRMVDNHTENPVWISDAPHRRALVEAAWTFEKVGEARLPVVPERGPRDNSMAKAKRLADKHGIEIEREGRDAWWVTCDALEHDDPLEGDHFATSQAEVLEKVERYVECLTTGYLEAVTAPAAPPPPACPETTAAAVEFALHQDGAQTPMDIACDLSLLYGRDITERQVRGAAIRLIHAGKARFFRGKLKPLQSNVEARP